MKKRKKATREEIQKNPEAFYAGLLHRIRENAKKPKRYNHLRVIEGMKETE
ncbi:hypothetical protein [Peribacillus saganii]|uniref:hypothetical protein n=1 Tax=Peribacillus saganii TaxID=2303992 RepID=UPI00131498F3|nr:hypothetical protein [Peribacillus saganii]